MSTLHVVILKLLYTEGASKSMVYAFSLQSDAESYAAIWNAKVEYASAVQEALRIAEVVWNDNNPYPDNAYSEYEAAKNAMWHTTFERLYAEKPAHSSFEDFEERGLALDKIMAEWEEANKHLHWGTVQDQWRQAYTTHRESLPQYAAYLEAMRPLIQQFPWCERYDPQDIVFCVEPCELVG